MSARNSAAKFQQMMIFHMFERYGESLRAATLCPRRVGSGQLVTAQSRMMAGSPSMLKRDIHA